MYRQHKMRYSSCWRALRFCVWALLVEFSIAAAVSAVEPTGSATTREMIEQFSADWNTLNRRYQVPADERATELRKTALNQWRAKLSDITFSKLSRPEQIDYLLLRTELDYRLKKLQRDQERDSKALGHLPYASDMIDVLRTREDVKAIEPEKLANRLNDCAKACEESMAKISKDESTRNAQTRLEGLRAAQLTESFEQALKEMHQFYNSYDPLYTWWAQTPYQRLLQAMKDHRTALRKHVVGVPVEDNDTILGLPIGDEGLAIELEHEWIALKPAELIQLANEEMKWCDEQMKISSNALGCGDDWRKALELVKAKHVAPGEQPKMIRELAQEAIRFLESHDLVTIPPLAAEGWTMTMMSPERQRMNPYFLGGDSIIVSFPTDSMTHDEKLMSMRSNNVHFARATVHHELIPGHHLQFYSMSRYRPYRKIFDTPFWIEGWALYWEMYLWDLDFARNHEDRVGMLFWRRHRCARIIFSLGYQSGKMTPEECIEFLIDRVGHERSAATAEVRRSIMGDYGPLYQAAYMLGGLQLRTMHREFVQTGKMTNRSFHDAILKENSIPIEILRAALSDTPLKADQKASWRFSRS